MRFLAVAAESLVWMSRTLVEAEAEVGSYGHQVGEDIGLLAFE